MKIKFGTGKNMQWTEMDVGSHSVLIQECFTGVGMETDQGMFGVAMRDDGIEVMLNGRLVWSSMELKSAPLVDAGNSSPPGGEKEK